MTLKRIDVWLNSHPAAVRCRQGALLGNGVARNRATSRLLTNRTLRMIQTTSRLSSADVVEHALDLKLETESMRVKAKPQQRTWRLQWLASARHPVQAQTWRDWPVCGSRHLRNGWTPRRLSLDVRLEEAKEKAARRSRYPCDNSHP